MALLALNPVLTRFADTFPDWLKINDVLLVCVQQVPDSISQACAFCIPSLYM